MSTIPQSSKDAAHFIRAGAAALGLRAIISFRNVRSDRGFHAGKGDIFGPDGQGKRDYSVRTYRGKYPRNKAGLSEASAAMDVTFRPISGMTTTAQARKHQRDFTAYLVSEAKAGRADLFEVIGPDADGKANYWGVLTDWEPRPKWAPASHRDHDHLGLWRDTEFSDRVAYFAGFYPAVPQPAPVSPEDPEPTTPEDPPAASDLEAFFAELEVLVAKYQDENA